ncbi:MAG TPA: undecaprenyldiphospho-muramoylpentapeptide beta-N-acetylglucosaminyltransferase [Candidatus Cloacimonadota bacterium]|jgi:UDP-N-acetylglucosamine--N-acetylmuramyl-(pentapeptide) pyrophosphoryl-undecaprenol N-acetylglucosamine transferase|nr:undecaprenyldiphospho-muramoylpentapeptide beta-N-acetylglucosaminyltransferase [Candidatus Cloacimonadales bacterium]HPY95739.1 undecaprenyldiphospho-muramoylpentapeptide beta-N-acetylglucosaminyltransferase [Candidatus Cloacimonadota bacterium]HQB40269.1 undecaprenyldiphospho-muramoylpentapeptide beta-N-acetylglucosaminyltransferase [Candidatus Cloacimonadota bacterium]
MINNKRIVVSAGGTGGHITPALVICEEFLKDGWEILYIGNKDSLEEKIVTGKNIPFYPIDVQKLYRNWTIQHIKFPFKLLNSVIKSYLKIREYKPAFVIGTGGFVSGPVGIASILAKFPLFIHEQNSYPGITTRFLGKYAKKVYIAYEESKTHFAKGKTIYTGNPIYKDKLLSDEKIDFGKYNLKQDSKKLLILGGSQGSLFINTLILKNIEFIQSNGFEILWQTGKSHLKKIQNRIGNNDGIFTFDFSDELHKMYNSADMVICRAGALTLSEIESKKLPSMIIPLPDAAGNHQVCNALDFQNKGYAVVLEQKHCHNFQKVFLSCSENLDQIKDKFVDSIHLEASSVIYNSIIKTLHDMPK